MRRSLAHLALSAAERAAPDALLRAGMRRIIASRLSAEETRTSSEREDMVRRWQSGPVALAPEAANTQHYEVPAAFFAQVLGPRLKYSACLWPEDVSELTGAEAAMLRLTVERARIEDGMRVLDLGCGWGALALWIAEHFPDTEVVAVSNSTAQGEYLSTVASQQRISNVRHVVADVNDLALDGSFDAVVSVEMFEHVRNHPELLRHLAPRIRPGAPVFVHVFAHREHLWEFEDRGPGDWMTRHFFAGGIMPSHAHFTRLVTPATIEESWWIDGTHYQRTLEAWLERLDGAQSAVAEVLGPVYGEDTPRWVRRWRMFFMACAEFFGYDGGRSLGVSHHLLRLP
jgi:cyclopropane-fatty-acyl-phospholipid synthase